VFNTTFNNISAILWRSVLLVEETGVAICTSFPTKKNSFPAITNSHLSKVFGNVKNPYIINQNHICSKNYYEVISG
jgi:hypothetical protein